MFLVAAEECRSAFSYFNLGCASYHLGHLQEAENVLGLANSLDSSRAETWGYLCLVLLRKETPEFNAAYQAMNESFKQGLSDTSILSDISRENLRSLQYKAARESLEQEMIILAGPKQHKRLANL